jgi:site-specific recombinase XerD
MSISTLAIAQDKTVVINDLIMRYELSNRVDGKSLKTITWYTELLKSFSNYIKWKQLRDDLASFNLNTVREYILYLRQKPCFEGHPYTPSSGKLLSQRTVQCHVRCLKAFSSWLFREGYAEANRLHNLKLPKAPIAVMEPLTHEEIKKVMHSINKNTRAGARNNAILVTLIDTGLRASEVASILRSNLNLTDGYIKVVGKGTKERIVPIGKYVQMILWSYIDKVRPEPANSDINNLFLSSNGKPITVNTIKLFFSRLAKCSGVQRLHAHLCRHTFSINYLLNGGDIFSLKEILGHTTLDMVNHYLHFTSSQITTRHHKYSPMDRLQKENQDPLNEFPLASPTP